MSDGDLVFATVLMVVCISVICWGIFRLGHLAGEVSMYDERNSECIKHALALDLATINRDGSVKWFVDDYEFLCNMREK